MVENTAQMRISIRAMLIAMGMMTGVAGVAKGAPAAGAPAAGAAKGAAAAAATATAPAKSGMLIGLSGLAASANNKFKNVVNQAVTYAKKGAYGQNILEAQNIDLNMMLTALVDRSPFACVYKDYVNGAVALVLYALYPNVNSDNLLNEAYDAEKYNSLLQKAKAATSEDEFVVVNQAGKNGPLLKQIMQHIATDLTQRLDALCAYEFGDGTEQSKALDWKPKVQSLCDEIDKYIILIKSAIEINKDTVEFQDDNLSRLEKVLNNLKSVLQKAKDKVVGSLLPSKLCFQQCSKAGIKEMYDNISGLNPQVTTNIDKFIDTNLFIDNAVLYSMSKTSKQATDNS